MSQFLNSQAGAGLSFLFLFALLALAILVWTFFDARHKRLLEAQREEDKREHIRAMAKLGYEEVVFQSYESVEEHMGTVHWGAPMKDATRQWEKRWAKTGVPPKDEA